VLPAGFDLRTIQIFVLVADLGGMTQAASRLGISQSAVSQAIASLEKLTDTRLFDRNIRPMALTSAGDRLYLHGNALLTAAKNTFNEVRKKERKSFSNVTIAMFESFANTIGHLVTRDLRDQIENCQIWSGNSPNQHQELLSHEVDILVTASRDLDDVPGMEHYDIFSEPFLLVCPADYKGQTDDFDELSKIPFIRYTTRSAMGRRIESQIKRMGLNLPSSSGFDTVTGQLKAVANGMGWCMTTPLCLLQEIHLLDRLRIIPMKTGKFRREISLIARKHEFGDLPATIAFTAQNILKEHAFPKLYNKLNWIEEEIKWSALGQKE
jgi:DNA-binding transcriptional LysR family regulator